MRHRQLIRISMAVIFALAPQRLLCWEEDLHYGLTKWLGIKAGFSQQESEAIAQGSQSPDDGKLYPAPFVVAIYTCLGKDPQASRFVQENHFPSYAQIPNDPSQRIVSPAVADNAASLSAREEISANYQDTPRVWSLRHFGMALHPVEDSWSHQGVPDIPTFPCSKQLSWGHPKNRGGWSKHDADLTYLHPEDTVATAKRVYELMLAYRKAKSGSTIHSSDWASLHGAVQKFAEANTKSKKRTWFSSDPDVPFSSYENRTFLDRISLPDDEGRTPVSLPASPFAFRSVLPSAQSSPLSRSSAEQFVDQFLTSWIVRKDLTDAVRFVDTATTLRTFSAGHEFSTPKANAPEQMKTLLAMWLIPDHGLVNELGHGLPGEGYKVLSEIPQELSVMEEFRSLNDAVRAPGSEGPYILIPLTGENDDPDSASPSGYAVLFQFRNAPRDSVELIIEKRAPGWMVVKFDWIAL